MTKQERINLPIIELSSVEMIMYSDGSGCYHLNANYLYAIGRDGDDNNDELVGSFSGPKSHIRQLPLINANTPVSIMSESGQCIGQTTFGEVQ